LVVVFVGAAITYIVSHRPVVDHPLVAGNFGQGPVYVAGGQGRDRVVYLPGATVQWGFSIRNDGKLPVTITNVQEIHGWTPFSTSAIFISTGDDLGTSHAIPGPLEPFRPFSLGPSQQRMFLHRVLFADCGPPPASKTPVTFGGFTVTYQALGVSHPVTIDGPRDAALRVNAPGGGC